MLTLAALNAPNGTDNSNKRTIVEVTGTLSGDYPADGEPIKWVGLSQASGGSVLINSSNPTEPLWVEAQMAEVSAVDPTLILAYYDYTLSTLRLFVSSTGAELAAGAYTPGLTGAVLRIKAEFQAN
jgi:hypothetical protein